MGSKWLRPVWGALQRLDEVLPSGKAEAPVLWPPHVKCWLIGKDSDAGRDWGQEEKGTTEDEMAGWHHWLNGRESEWTPGVGDGQGGLACCDSWGRKESDMTEWLNWLKLLPSPESPYFYDLILNLQIPQNIFQLFSLLFFSFLLTHQ